MANSAPVAGHMTRKNASPRDAELRNAIATAKIADQRKPK
jgi:hypothetical protein